MILTSNRSFTRQVGCGTRLGSVVEVQVVDGQYMAGE